MQWLKIFATIALPVIAGCASSRFGKTATGEECRLYTLEGKDGLKLEVTDFGGRLVRAWVPDRQGKLADVTLGWNTVEEYEKLGFSMGTLIGRYGNRIKDGSFTLDGKTYQLPVNEDKPPRHNSLHAGPKGWDAKVWSARPFKDGEISGLELTLVSPDGDMGFPGNVKAKVTYKVLPGNVWRVDYELTTDKPTVVNPTHHSYWNLAGEASGNVLKQILKVNADKFTKTDDGLIPVADTPVAGTGFDFRQGLAIGYWADWMKAQKWLACTDNWYDHNFRLNGKAGEMKEAAELYDPESGRVLNIWTTEPCMQMYGAQNMDGTQPAKAAGKTYCQCAGVALETQHHPDAPNHPEYPTTVLRPGEVFKSTTEYRFSVR